MLVRKSFDGTVALTHYVNEHQIDRKDIQSILQVGKELFVLLYWKD